MAGACLFVFLTLVLVQLASLKGETLTGRVQLGSKLVGKDQAWFSDNGTFALGFTSPDSSDEFQLAIWYARLPGVRTVVWSANRKYPVGRDASLVLETTGNLLLTDRNSPVWASNTSGQSVQTAVLSENGNLVLYTNNLDIIWQSFSWPTDTLLPGQPLTESLQLTSPESYSGGFYSLKMTQEPTSLSLALSYISPKSNSNFSYWSGPEISNTTGAVTALLDNSGSFSMSYGTSSTGLVYIHQNDGESSGDYVTFRRITIETTGNLRLYRWGNGSRWVSDWAAVSNPCAIAGICGNGICVLDSNKTNTSCTCPLGNFPADRRESGCPELGTTGNCTGTDNSSSGGFKAKILPQTNYFAGDSIIKNYTNVTASSSCGAICLSDCNCVASVYGVVEEKAYCWTLRSLVYGGLQDPSSTMFVKIPAATTAAGGGENGGGGGGVTRVEEGGGKQERVLILPLVLCVGAVVCFLCLLLLYSVRKRRALKSEMNSSMMVTGAPVCFSFHELQIATCNFSHSQMLGTGGFGTVYRGNLPDGTLIAVKKLERMLPQGEREFKAEVTTIGSMHHFNLVRLRGFCSERAHRLLVYEFMKNGSLDKWIFPSYRSDNQERLLDWKTRFRIAVETAQGIAYFHEQCRDRIIHCDIKPENILLDENFCPKVSDFGLAKLMGREHSHVITMVRGTRGYLAPEWISNRPITVKADVYSYGMLLLEIIGGRRNLDMSLDAEDFFYPGWAFKEMVNGMPSRVVDKRLKGKMEEEEVVRGVNVAFWCIQEEVWMRPSMGEVVKMLEGSVEIKAPPMPQTVSEMVNEGLDHVYRAMKTEFTHSNFSTTINSQQLQSSEATCSYSTMSPR